MASAASAQSLLPVPKAGRHHRHRHRGRRSASEDPVDNMRHNININNNNQDAVDEKTSKTRRNERVSRRSQHHRVGSLLAADLDEQDTAVELPLPPLPVLNDNDLYLQRQHARRTLSAAPRLQHNNNNIYDQVLVQNGRTGGDLSSEVTSAANIFAHLGLALNLRPSSMNGAINTGNERLEIKQNNTMHLSKEHVVEVKEEDERRTSPEACDKKTYSDSEEENFEDRNRTQMTNSATQTQAGTPGTPTDPNNVTAAGEKEAAATASFYHSAWPPVDPTLWHSGPSSLGGPPMSSSNGYCTSSDVPDPMSASSSVVSGPIPLDGLPSRRGFFSSSENPGAMSASSSLASGPIPLDGLASRRAHNQQQLGAKVEMVYGLLSMLGTHDRQDMSRKLLAMSSSPDSCVAMRQSGCLPLLVQLLHSSEQDAEIRNRAAQALSNMVHAYPDDKRSRREGRVLKLLEQVRLYCEALRSGQDVETMPSHTEDGDKHPGPTIAALMKLSFDEEHRHAMCQLGGLYAIAQLIQVDHEAHGSTTNDQNCVTLRRYAGMALTNLTFGDGTNKALLCSFRDFMRALVAQLASPSEDLRQVTASVLRNLSWRADSQSKQTLREVGAVTALMCSAMEAQKESTLKSVLSALWNLSAHCSLNKVDICAVDGALVFLVQMLSYKAPSKTLAIIENAGGILRNISSHVAVREDYRATLREHNCLQVLLQQLKSTSLTIVSNACGTLWNLSARCQEDQRTLWALGAPAMLRSLVHSKHKMISMGSSATLKNLLSAKPENDDSCFRHLDSTARSLGLQSLPGLYARKQKALEQELDQTLTETFDNIEPSTSPSTSTVGLRDDKFVFSLTERDVYRQRPQQPLTLQKPSPKIRPNVVSHSDSKESVTSTHSDSVYERLMRAGTADATQSGSLKDDRKLHSSMSDSDRVGSDGGKQDTRASSDRKFLQRYLNNLNSSSTASGNSSAVVAMNVSSDQNKNPVNMNVVENGVANLMIAEEGDSGSQKKWQAWTEQRPASGDGKQPLSIKEEFNASTSVSEKEEAVEGAQSSNVNNNDEGSSSAPTAAVRPRGSQSQAFVPVRNKYMESGAEEDLECPTQDRPIDFSQRYASEIEPSKEHNSQPVPAKREGKKKGGPAVYGDYAETDLDQPTDYSLQYGEEDDLSDFEAPEIPISIHEDTVKMYFTEGTPYETPFNHSTSTSLSDLRIEPAVKEDNDEDLKTESETVNVSQPEPAATETKEIEAESIEAVNVVESGSISPVEKPVQFCDEGTPGVCMSRFDSLSSLDKNEEVGDEIDGKETVTSQKSTDVKGEENVVGTTPPGSPPTVHETSGQSVDQEAGSKIVKLNPEHQYAEETPLMFSRASSLGSLSSYEQQSILDDRSSVVSEFSRLTSGVVSPSELPDSPSQLVPASPRHLKAPVEFTNRLSDASSSALRVLPARFTGSTRPLAHPIIDKAADNSVFEDRFADYKVEDTPMECSRATSLSSLSIDDEPRDVRDGPSRSGRSSLGREEGMEKTDVEKELALVSEGEEDEDEDILADCINIGMQNSRSKQSHSTRVQPKLGSHVPQQPTQPASQQLAAKPTALRQPVPTASASASHRRPGVISKSSGIPVSTGIPTKIPSVTRKVLSPALTPGSTSRGASPATSRYTPPVRSHSAPNKQASESNGVCEDSMYRYCTEGTPANISHAGSHSDLSVLSFPNEGEEELHLDQTGTELSDDSSTFSGDNENILAECIQSGMPKAKTDASSVLSHPSTSGAMSKRASVPNSSMASRRVASASPSGSVKSHHSPTMSPISVNRNVNGSPQRKPTVSNSPQRTYPQPAASAPRPAVRMGIKSTSTPVSSPANGPRSSNITPPKQRQTGGPRIVRAVNRNVYPGGRLPTVGDHANEGLLQPVPSNDEMVQFACEDSPCNFSSRSSLSDLTINSSECSRHPVRHLPSEGPASDSHLRFATEDTPVEGSYAASLSSLGVDDDVEPPVINMSVIRNAPNLRVLLCMPEGCSSDEATPSSGGAVALTLSDSSDKFSDKMSDRHQPNPSQSSASEEVVTVLSRNTSLSSLSVESLGSCDQDQALLEQCISSAMPKSRSKETDGNTKKPVSKLPCLAPRSRLSTSSKQEEKLSAGMPGPSTQDEYTSETPKQESERPRFNSEALSDSGIHDKVSEEPITQGRKFNFVEDVDVMKDSATSTGTWADDSSPNEISCPSVSITAPTGGSIKSENYRELSDLVEENHDSASDAQDLPSLTDSWLLEAEATKVASAVMGHSLNSIDSILPPSEMGSLGSLSQSFSGRSLPHTLLNRNCTSRKKSLPSALNNGIGNDVSVEFNLSASFTCHLDNVRAPSMLDEMGDSENSFMSIASITSEAADIVIDAPREGFPSDATYELARPAFMQLEEDGPKYPAHVDALDQPSTYHEITELSTDQDLTLEPGTETIASDNELNDEVADTKTLEAPDLPCDSQRTTPSSSVESSPKKGLTPKQRRELARDRFQTYTISSPSSEPKPVQGDQETLSPKASSLDTSPTPKQRRQMTRDRYQTYTINPSVEQRTDAYERQVNEVKKSATVGDVPSNAEALKKPRVTPKQRRQEDRDRFRTRTLDKDCITGSN
ncbi:adenomatous polyposis coli protein isoform X3 [Frankliniella occidentalis]|uniref:Adenomatous polyposis coli protein isoform X3 n=1 Tax=Frankliniella occidentalis TaxID=133901 RepID=A0A9C6XBY2_FRAOC|nr:adenomatous polyposis coli protein isoform X3 [Frankliniella occidentalis]